MVIRLSLPIWVAEKNQSKYSNTAWYGWTQETLLFFAQYLINLGFDVYIYDHRGHGTDKKINELGHISNSKGYQLIIDDAITVSKYIAKNNKSNKFILFGHSMGSLSTAMLFKPMINIME